ncbi:MAG: class I SAM-dependent methyltransferase [Actinomycetia bacterium]|nr:class I SAM-dependent methyltransferase [Actinomycetes bacterium]MCP4958616.1 class I SAM-dependent methyltransferase [Actinomycetes bacterium]
MSGAHWFEPLADHLGPTYLRYAFTKGTKREVAFLVDVLGLAPGMRVLDVGCGPGRHAHALAESGIEVVGIDISERFVELANDAAPHGATFIRLDARDMPFDEEFDAAYTMCQGAFGLQAGPATSGDRGGLAGDRSVLTAMAQAVRPGGKVGVAAFSAYFQVRHLEDGTGGTFDAATGVHHEVTVVHDPDGTGREVDLWTTCFTPRELILLAESISLEPTDIWSVCSGSHYERRHPTLDEPEFFMVSIRP